MKSDDYAVLGILALVLAGAVGYVMNLVAIAHWSESIGMLVLRCIGALVAPLGAILGYL